MVDFYQLLAKLDSFASVDLNRKLFGLQHFQMEIMRRGKWAVNNPSFSNRRNYPNFLSGLLPKFFICNALLIGDFSRHP